MQQTEQMKRLLHAVRQCCIAAVMVLGSAACVQANAGKKQETQPGSWSTVFSSDWGTPVASVVGLQRAKPEDLVEVDDPVNAGKRAIRASVASNEDFAGVANGVPRAEIVFPGLKYTPGRAYAMRWSTYLPVSVELDPEHVVVIMQIHQDDHFIGPPPLALNLQGARYQIWERGGNHAAVKGPEICCADQDKGRWVQWKLEYVPDSTGQHAMTKLWKDGTLVHSTRGQPNAYPNDTVAYLKMGLYPNGWATESRHVMRMTLLFGPVSIAIR